MSVQRRKFDSVFKRNAVQLTEEPGRTVADVSEGLGIGKDLLYRWRREHRTRKSLAFPGNGHLQQDIEMKFRFIENNRSLFPVKKMCHVLTCFFERIL